MNDFKNKLRDKVSTLPDSPQLIDGFKHGAQWAYHQILENGREIWYSDGSDVWHTMNFIDAKYKALIINIEPIKKETAEDVLRDWVSYMGDPTKSDMSVEFFRRAKEALGEDK